MMTREELKPLCIYHGHCDDGFAAAWCVRKALGNDVEFYPGVYQKVPPPYEGRDVIFVDFSYKRPVLDDMARNAHSILILDHHKTAQEDLADYAVPLGDGWHSHLKNVAHDDMSGWRQPYALFDMSRSGAALAWDFFVGGSRPDVIEYVQDRDLWRKQLPGGDEFTIALRSYPQDFLVWDQLILDLGARSLISEGHSIQRYYRLRVEELKRSAYRTLLGGHHVWISNAPYFAASEVAGELAERGLAFGACYFEVEAGRFQYSMRSRGDFDVSLVARMFDGGGHKAAAGFTTIGPAHRPLRESAA